MNRCPGCGTELFTMGCPNTECGMSMGGTYVNGVKVATASGRRLVPDERAALLRQKVAAMTDEECAQLWERLKAL
jgi:hypothetical protein